MRLREVEPLVGLLEAKLDLLRIDGFLFDLDDTILETTTYFAEHKARFSRWASQLLRLSEEHVLEVFNQAAHDAFDHLYVCPERWDLAARITSEKLIGKPDALDGGIYLMKELFLDTPEMIPGARLALDIFLATGRKMALVTHAPFEWTKLKVEKNGLWRYFDAVLSVDENRPKGIEDWIEGARLLELPYERLMGFGDNVGADIVPMTELGIRAIAVKPQHSRSNGDLPPGVLLLESLIEAPDKILTL